MVMCYFYGVVLLASIPNIHKDRCTIESNHTGLDLEN